MTDFKAKMHQIRFRLGLRPRPRWRAYSALPRPLAGFGGPLRDRGRGWAGLGWAGLGWAGEEGGKGEGRGSGGEGKVTVEPEPLRDLLRHCQGRSQKFDLGDILYVLTSHCNFNMLMSHT